MENDPQKMYEQIGENLKALRAAYDNGKGISQASLSKELGISQQNYAAYETGRNRMPLESLSKIAAFFGVSVNSILIGSSSQVTFLSKLNERHFSDEEMAEINNFVTYIEQKRMF